MHLDMQSCPQFLDGFSGSQRIQLSHLDQGLPSTRQSDNSGPHSVNNLSGSLSALPFQNCRTPDNVGDPPCLDPIDQWLHECFETHGDSSDDPPELPTIVVHNVDEHTVRLVESNGRKGEYLTLSHHWARDPHTQPKKTTRENLDGHKISIPIDCLNDSLRDAIQLTSKLHFEYMWIDSLCIIQDDAADWAQESSKMSDVYGNSVMTIFAAAPSRCFVRLQALRSAESGFRPVDFGTREYQYIDESGRPVKIPACPPITTSRVSIPIVQSQQLDMASASSLEDWYCKSGY